MPPLIALIVSGSLVALLLRSRIGTLALDVPNERSLHTTPIPRLGGVGIIGGIAAAWAYAMPVLDPLLLIALLLLICVSLLDDVKNVRVPWRLFVHGVSATLAVVALLHNREWWVVATAILATAWMINLYNFMDGADGLAGGMAAIGFGAYGVVALAGGDVPFAAVNFSIAAAALGFLWFNFPPARVFMGDVGAIPLGFLAAVMHIAGWLRSDWPWWFGGVIFSPFIADASLTLAKRLMRGAKIWQAHREHYYQRVVQSGWGHRKTALAEYALMLVSCGIAIAGAYQSAVMQLAFIAAVLVGYAALAAVLERYLNKNAEV